MELREVWKIGHMGLDGKIKYLYIFFIILKVNDEKKIKH